MLWHTIFLLTILPSFATFTPSDLPGPFLLRRGDSCPGFLEVSASSSSPPNASAVLVRDQPCTSGALLFDNTEDQLAQFLKGSPDAGGTLSLFVTERLDCPAYSFNPGAVFTFVKANANLTIDFARAFGRNGTAVGEDGPYTFEQGAETLVLGTNCLYTRLTESEVDEQRGECFPGRSTVQTRRGRSRIDALTTGTQIWDGSQWTRVIGWTHRDAHHIGVFARVCTNRGVVTLSRGHLLYANGRLVPAADISVGMRTRGAMVSHVGWIVDHGLYNPQTESGDIQVDGVVCSTYTTAVKPLTAHALLAPLRFFASAHIGRFLLPLSRVIGPVGSI